MASPFKVAASSPSSSSEVPPEGNLPAVLVGLVDLGTHREEFQGDRFESRKVLLCWELSGEHRSDGTPFVVALSYNVNSKLRQMLEGWRGKPLAENEQIDLVDLLGRACLANIIHSTTSKGKVFAKILGIGPMIRGMSAPQPHYEPYTWHFGAGPLRLPEWLPWLFGEPVEDVIGRSKELGGNPTGNGKAEPVGTGASGSNDENENEIPF
jgi:hypothetical protein